MPAMKTVLFPILVAAASAAIAVRGQGSMFVYDQQSVTNRTIGRAGAPIQEDQPMGQSFPPSLAGVGFVQLEFHDVHPTNGLGATVYVNLLADSITGTVLGTTATVPMPDNFFDGVTHFFFPTTIPVTPGTAYYLQPVVLSVDDLWSVIVGNLGYQGGSFYALGVPHFNVSDLLFRA